MMGVLCAAVSCLILFGPETRRDPRNSTVPVRKYYYMYSEGKLMSGGWRAAEGRRT